MAALIASRSLGDLDVRMRPLVDDLLSRASGAGIDLLVTCTYRSNAVQAALYAQGRTAQGRIVTNAVPGKSRHNAVDAQGRPASMAVDVVPMHGGKPVWSVVGADGDLWRQVGEIGESCGLLWAGRWKGSLREYPHFQLI